MSNTKLQYSIMPTTSLIEELPKIVKEGRQEAQRILERLSSNTRIGLQTNELVLPAKDTSGLWKGKNERAINKDWMNRLIYGDNLLTMQVLLAEDEATELPSLRGKVNLIYIDPPFDSKADYRTKINLPEMDIEQKPTVIEQFAYSDTWQEWDYILLSEIHFYSLRKNSADITELCSLHRVSESATKGILF